MLHFISSLPDFDQDTVTKSLWKRLSNKYGDRKGICYYKHPVLGTHTGVMADLTLFTQTDEPVAIRCIPYQINEIRAVYDEYWTVNDNDTIDSPLLELDDFVVAMEGLIKLDRKLRRRLQPKGVLALPLISESEFVEKFGNVSFQYELLWQGKGIENILVRLQDELTEEEWLSFRAVIQTATPLTKTFTEKSSAVPTTLSTAIFELERQIKTLDLEQEKVSIQIPPGPQRIRGLAGTGKTVLLAMRAANIHRHYPRKKLLFTFHTRSLYNQTRRLIERFYGIHKGNTEPDWNMLHIRHAWGSRNRAGVYSDICSKKGLEPLTFKGAQYLNHEMPFQACCEQLLDLDIEPVYDYVIVDEAQDFPIQYFKVLRRLTREPHCIYWAYDQLQSLAASSLAIPGPEILFGEDGEGNPLVSFDDHDYSGGIQKDFVLNKSYRCPQDVLMLAHAIGLGLYNRNGCVQMLELKESWTAVGYEIESDSDAEWREGHNVTIFRPAENSPNQIDKMYRGSQELIVVKEFISRTEEFDWIAQSIASDISSDGVAPEDIIVIILDALSNRAFSKQIQRRLVQYDVPSVIPGVIHDPDSYAEEGRVTISSVFRAKGNEAHIVYIVGFEELYNYAEAIPNRNRAFTAISRSKAWVRITGTGSDMARAKEEIETIQADIPRFHFEFPDMANLRNLDAVTKSRRRKRTLSNRRIAEILEDPEFFAAASPDLVRRLTSRLSEHGSED